MTKAIWISYDLGIGEFIRFEEMLIAIGEPPKNWRRKKNRQ